MNLLFTGRPDKHVNIKLLIIIPPKRILIICPKSHEATFSGQMETPALPLASQRAAPGEVSLIIRMKKDRKKVKKGTIRKRNERAIKLQIVCTNFMIKNSLLRGAPG